jgi:anti-sigma-K factor RskA
MVYYVEFFEYINNKTNCWMLNGRKRLAVLAAVMANAVPEGSRRSRRAQPVPVLAWLAAADSEVATVAMQSVESEQPF